MEYIKLGLRAFKFDRAKLCFGLSAVCFILFGILFGASSLQAQNSKPVIAAEPFTTIYKQSVSEPLNKAASESKDKGLSQFVQNLIKSYELDKRDTTVTDDPSSLANLLPDIININRKALTAPLIQAEKLIKDKEIAEFYARFLSTLGIK
jgi:hypothetical protein